MKRNTSRVLIVLLLIILIPFCCIFGSPDIAYEIKKAIVSPPASTPEPMILEITNAFSRYENGEIPFVDFSTITSFQWDRLYIIGPYSTYKELTYRFGISWMACDTNTDAYDGWVFLVFASGKKIVRCFDYPVVPYDFTYISNDSEAVPIQEAHFIILNDDGIVGFVGGQ